MNCDDYLSMLATFPVEELAHGPAGEHAAGCRECDRVTRVVAERERNMLMALEGLDSSVPATQTAASALARSRRRRIARYYEMGIGTVMVAAVLFITMSRTDPVPSPGSRVSETFQLQCLSPEQAAEVLRPRIQPTARISFRPSSALGVIKVEASREEIAMARSVLERYDRPAEAQCAVQVTVPKVP